MTYTTDSYFGMDNTTSWIATEMLQNSRILSAEYQFYPLDKSRLLSGTAGA